MKFRLWCVPDGGDIWGGKVVKTDPAPRKSKWREVRPSGKKSYTQAR